MAGVVNINTPSWAAGLQSASNTAETYMRLKQGAAESDARVAESGARTAATEVRSRLTEEMVEAQQFENVVRADERQRLEVQRAEAVQFDIDSAKMGAVEAAEQPSITDSALANMHPETRARVLGLIEEGENRDVQTENQGILLEQIEDILDDTEAPLRDSSKQTLWQLGQDLGEWDASNGKVGVSPDEAQAKLDALYKRDGAFFAGKRLIAGDVETLRRLYSPDGAATPELEAAISHRMGGGTQEEANEMAMRGDHRYKGVLEAAENRAYEQRDADRREARAQASLDAFIDQGGDMNNEEERKAWQAASRTFFPAGGQLGPNEQGPPAAPPPSRGVVQQWMELGVPMAEAQQLHNQGVTPEQYSAQQGGGGGEQEVDPSKAPTAGMPKGESKEEYQGMIVGVARMAKAAFENTRESNDLRNLKPVIDWMNSVADDQWGKVTKDISGVFKVFGWDVSPGKVREALRDRPGFLKQAFNPDEQQFSQGPINF